MGGCWTAMARSSRAFGSITIAVGVCGATDKGTAARMATEHSIAYVLALYGAQDHEEAVAVVQRTMHRYEDHSGHYNIDHIVDGLIDHEW
mgnify:CR=1 FL=1